MTAPDPHRAKPPTARFLLAHPAHFIALGFGVGLAPVAPGTVATLWAWVAFLVLQSALVPTTLGWLLVISLAIGWWACTVTARNMAVMDPCEIVWDEIVTFWVVLWLLLPADF